MTANVDITDDHMARAYAQMRKHGTPPLEVLRSHWVLYTCIRNRARGIADGRPLPPEPVATAPPAHTEPAPAPLARRRDDRPTGPTPFDIRAAQSGEYAHRDDESEPI